MLLLGKVKSNNMYIPCFFLSYCKIINFAYQRLYRSALLYYFADKYTDTCIFSHVIVCMISLYSALFNIQIGHIYKIYFI